MGRSTPARLQRLAWCKTPLVAESVPGAGATVNRVKTSARRKWAALAAVVCIACGARSGLFEAPANKPIDSAAGAPNRYDGTSGTSAASGTNEQGAGAGGASSGMPAVTPLPLSEVCSVAVREYCIRNLSCGQDFWGPRGLEHLDQCIANQACGLSSELLAALDKGELKYDPLAAAACRARFDADLCAPGLYSFYPQGVIPWLDACPGALIGHRAEGETCRSGAECEAPLYCELNGICPGTCTKRTPIGASCSLVPCESGTHCLAFDSWDPNSKHRCVYEGQPGESCDPLCTEDTCTLSGDCQSPNWCDPETRRCTKPNKLGEPCGSLGVGAVYVTCEAQLFCDRKAHSGLGRCEPQSDVGGPCQFRWEADCLPGLLCDVEAMPTEPSPTGKCVHLPSQGEACASGNQCASDLRCVSGVCQTLLSDGQSCNQTSDCGPTSWCADGVCVPIPYPGEACVVFQGQAACAFGRCIDGICSKSAQIGEACVQPGDCAAGAECKNERCVPRYGCGALVSTF